MWCTRIATSGRSGGGSLLLSFARASYDSIYDRDGLMEGGRRQGADTKQISSLSADFVGCQAAGLDCLRIWWKFWWPSRLLLAWRNEVV